MGFELTCEKYVPLFHFLCVVQGFIIVACRDVLCKGLYLRAHIERFRGRLLERHD